MSVQLVAVSRKMAAAGGRLCFCHSQGRKPLHRLHSMLLMKCRQRDINGDIRKCELFTHFAQATPCDRKSTCCLLQCRAIQRQSYDTPVHSHGKLSSTQTSIESGQQKGTSGSWGMHWSLWACAGTRTTCSVTHWCRNSSLTYDNVRLRPGR